jgi:DNA helicase IV
MAYYVNLPLVGELTPDQNSARNEEDAIALTGGPGTGKSVVCLWRHIRNCEIGVDSLLLTYTKSLEHYLKLTAKPKSVTAYKNIDRIYNWMTHHTKEYDEIIVDEAQDIDIDRHKRLSKYASNISFGADDAQSLYPEHSSSFDELEDLYSDNEFYELKQNFRNSSEILDFVKSVLPNFHIPQSVVQSAKESGILPIVKMTSWEFDEEVVDIVELIEQYAGEKGNIGFLAPSINLVGKYFKAIKNELSADISCSILHSDMEESATINEMHFTTFKSAKGLEFDTVIIPNFDSMDWWINNDKSTDKEYYVAFTRAKKNLVLLCKNTPRRGNDNFYELY